MDIGIAEIWYLTKGSESKADLERQLQELPIQIGKINGYVLSEHGYVVTKYQVGKKHTGIKIRADSIQCLGQEDRSIKRLAEAMKATEKKVKITPNPLEIEIVYYRKNRIQRAYVDFWDGSV